MSLLTPERVPVKVYKWDDAGAPQLDKTAGCVATIFKACLAIGYGTKEPAGWTMPFEDTAAGIKVLRPEISPHTDFYLRLSADTGTEMAAQVYLNMTDANTGDLKLQCATAFKYAKANSTGKWLLIASPRGLWFFCDQRFSDGVINKTGAYFYAGDLQNAVDLQDAVYLQHTGGTNNDGAYSDIFSRNINNAVDKNAVRYVSGKILLGASTVLTVDVSSLADSTNSKTTAPHLTPLFIIVDGGLYFLPNSYATLSAATANNFDVIDAIAVTASSMIVHGTGGRNSSNLYINTDSWSY